jgi:hypothetical protein
MKTKIAARPFFVIAFCAAVALLCVDSVSKDANFAADSTAATNETVKVDYDFTRMNPTMRMTYTYRLAAKPSGFAGKTLRISGVFLTVVDKKDGKRRFGCLMGDSGGCSCCSPGGVLEFMPKDSYVWPTNFPPVESRITLTGRLQMFEVGTPEQSFTIPRLVDADISALR